ncbi:hypothetical protein E4H12_08670 [Candidatus Thorarchaeota archaeon]|nr:MAG: hypothetical protein E4H12_08670 [Candidatus Thorarchaeota archaeon]
MSANWSRNLFTDNKKLTVINFFGGPGCGKSTTAAELFARMKKGGYKVELIHEVAKDLIWEEAHHIFGEQDYIFALQHRLIRRLTRHDIDYAVVDCSILLGLFYYPWDFPPSFKQFVEDVFDSYDNINIFLDRSPDIEYVQAGRNETPEQALAKDNEMLDYFATNKGRIDLWRTRAGQDASETCYRIVQQHVKPSVSA